MSAEADTPEEAPKKASKLPLILGLVMALVGAGGGFFAVQSGMIGGGGTDMAETAKEEPADEKAEESVKLAFVALDPLVISLPKSGGRDHLRFAAQLEVAPDYVSAVEAIKPRIVDVLNSYLRAVDLAELEDPAALMRLRAQMLRRVQIVAGDDKINDLLIMEFVLS